MNMLYSHFQSKTTQSKGVIMVPKETRTCGISFRCTSAEQKVFKEVADSMAMSTSTMFKYLAFRYARENRLQTYMTLFPHAVPIKPESPKPVPQPPQFPRAEMSTSCMKDEATAKHISSLLDNPNQSLQELATQYRCDPYELSEDWNRYNLYKHKFQMYYGETGLNQEYLEQQLGQELDAIFNDED